MQYLWVVLFILFVSTHASSSAVAQEGGQRSGLFVPSPMPGPAGGPPITWWTGGSITNSFAGGYVGVMGALNPQRDLWADGWILRFEGSYGEYDYDLFNRNTFRFQDTSIPTHGAAMLFGYRHKMGDATVTGWLGITYETHDNPDRFATIRGTEAGLRGMLEYYTPLGPSFDLYAQARYATPFETWGAFGRLGWKVFDRIAIGPEASYFSNEAPYREASVGGFVRYDGIGWSASLSGGYRDPLTSGVHTGYYAGLFLSFDVR
jgi:hypothetical protein